MGPSCWEVEGTGAKVEGVGAKLVGGVHMRGVG